MAKRFILNFVSALVLAASAMACSGGTRAAIVGQWEATKPSITFEFSDGGIVSWKQAGRTFTGKYKFAEDTTLELEMAGDLGTQTVYLTDVTVQGDQLTLTLEGRQIQFARVVK